jgi:hypothetical protein
MPVKKFAQTLLRLFGLRLSRIDIPEPVAPFDLLDVVIQVRLRIEGTSFYFLQIGANDGILADSFTLLIRRYGLQGCFVEPIKNSYDILLANYSDQPHLEFKNVSIEDLCSHVESYEFKRPVPDPNLYSRLLRSDLNNIQTRTGRFGNHECIDVEEVEKTTFSSLLSSINSSSISLLYIDSESSNDKIVYNAFSSGLYPPIIHYEWTEISPKRRHHLKMTLLDNGYRFINVGAHTICLRSNCD